MAVDDSSRKAAVGQGRKRGAAGSGPGGRRGAGGGGAGAADLTGAVEQGFDPRRTDGGGAAGGAGGGGPGGQQEIGGGGGFWQNDDDGMGVGGRFTSTPGAEGLSGAMEQDFDPRRADGGGAAEEMDRNGAVGLTSYQKRHAQRQRAKQRAQAPD